MEQVCIQLPTSAVNVTPPAFAAACCAAPSPAMQQSIDISYPPGFQQQTRHMLLQQAYGTERGMCGYLTVT